MALADKVLSTAKKQRGVLFLEPALVGNRLSCRL
jgi:hypothetical protein